MKAELKNLMNDCKRWVKEFKNSENKIAYKEKYNQYVEIIRVCKTYLEIEDTKVSRIIEKEEVFSHSDKLFFRCIDLIRKFTITVEGDEGFVFKKNGSTVTDKNKDYTYVMEGYDIAEYEESDTVTIFKKYDVWETESLAKEIEVTILFETEDQVYAETKKIIIPPLVSTYEIIINIKWLPKLKINRNDPMAVYQLSSDYDYLSGKTMLNFIDTMQSYLTVFKGDILSVTTAYTTAYENYTNAIEKAKEAEELKAQWIANAWSIAGGGFLSWLSSTNKVLNLIKRVTKIKDKKTLDEIENVLEDITQTVLDKAATTGSTPSAIAEFQLNSPLSFQNELEKKGVTILSETLNAVKDLYSVAEGKKSDLDNKAKAGIFVDLEIEWELFQKIYASFLDMEIILTDLWSITFQIRPSLATNLELLLWAKWISIQKTHKKVRSARGGGKGGWSESIGLPLEKPIIECLSRLGLLDKLGIDFATLDYSWDDEYEILRKWAKGFNPKQLF